MSKQAASARTSRWEGKRKRFADGRLGVERGARPLGRGFFLTLGGILAAIAFVMVMTVRTTEPTVAAAVLQQIPASTASTEGGRVSISAEEVASKKLVAWDYKQGSTKIPLLAYATPSGVLKVAVRMCEPCNSTSFHVEGKQLVCNACGSRWELETSTGVTGGCQAYPPELLPGTLEGGRLTVDEEKVAGWKPRV